MERRNVVVAVCVLACVCNVLLTAGLAAGGLLKTVQPDDTDTLSQFEDDGETYTVEPGTRPFVAEPITDVDAFYNAVVRLENDGVPLYNAETEAVQQYHYAPVVVLLFYPLSLWGYGVFKALVLLTSVLVVAAGSYAILQVETEHRQLSASRQTLLVLALATVGFGPVVSNFKVGQMAPLIYGAVAVFWYAYRRGNHVAGGVALWLPALTKPYFLAPAALLASNRHKWGAVAVAASIVGALSVSAVVAGPASVVDYLRAVAEHASTSEADGVPAVSAWGVEVVYPFFTLDTVALAGRVVAAAGFSWLWVEYLRGGETDRDAVGLFAAALVLVPFVIQQATNIDIAVLLAGFLVLGVELYDRGRTTAVAALGVSFLLAHGHWYVMEAVVGTEHPNLFTLSPPAVRPLLQLLQPGVYAVYVLAGLAAAVILRPTAVLRET